MSFEELGPLDSDDLSSPSTLERIARLSGIFFLFRLVRFQSLLLLSRSGSKLGGLLVTHC